MQVWAMWYNEHNWPGVYAISSRFLRIVLQLCLSWYATLILTLKVVIVHMSDTKIHYHSFEDKNRLRLCHCYWSQSECFTTLRDVEGFPIDTLRHLKCMSPRQYFDRTFHQPLYTINLHYHCIVLNNRWQHLITHLQLKLVLTHWGRTNWTPLKTTLFKFYRNVFLDTW